VFVIFSIPLWLGILIVLIQWFAAERRRSKEADEAARLARLAATQAWIDRDEARFAKLNSPSALMIAGMSSKPAVVDLSDDAIWNAAWKRAHDKP
jgi:hypothetical protein